MTRHGAVVAAVIPIAETDREDFVLARSSEILADLAAAEVDLPGGRTRPAAAVLDELA